MAFMELGEHLDALFQCQLLKIAAAMTAWVTARQGWKKPGFFKKNPAQWVFLGFFGFFLGFLVFFGFFWVFLPRREGF
jgi:hypothetical protein